MQRSFVDAEMASADLEQQMIQLFSRWMTSAASRAGVKITQNNETLAAEELADTSAQLENFSGNSEDLTAAEWIDRLEIAKDVGAWTEAKMRSVLLAKLTGPARSWHLTGNGNLSSFDEWKAKFLEEFSPQQRQRKLIDDLNDRIQKGGEPLQLYIWRSVVIGVQLGMTPEDVKGQILSNLEVEYKCLVQELQDRTHNDIPDLLRDIERSIKFNQSMLAVVRVSNTPYEIRLRWQPASNGYVPKMAFNGGVDSNGEKLYVARTIHRGDLTPGKLAPSHGVTYIPYDGREYCHREYEVLVSDCILEWVACTAPCRLPPGSIQAGKTKDGEPLYIARAPHRDSMTPGKFQLSKQACFLSWGGREHRHEAFEVLACHTIALD